MERHIAAGFLNLTHTSCSPWPFYFLGLFPNVPVCAPTGLWAGKREFTIDRWRHQEQQSTPWAIISILCMSPHEREQDDLSWIRKTKTVELYVLIGTFLFFFKLVFSEDFRDESRVKLLRCPPIIMSFVQSRLVKLLAVVLSCYENWLNLCYLCTSLISLLVCPQFPTAQPDPKKKIYTTKLHTWSQEICMNVDLCNDDNSNSISFCNGQSRQSELWLISSADVVNLKGNNIIWYVIIIYIICYSNVI